jgi:hypothetical protein
MRITIKEPGTGDIKQLDAQPEDYFGEQGWRIIYPDKDSFLIARRNGDWKAVDEEDINPEIIDVIMRELDTHDRYTSETSS